MDSFSSLYIGILAATEGDIDIYRWSGTFQFPLHRDPRCNTEWSKPWIYCPSFQFPLHRDPRCNPFADDTLGTRRFVSVPFTSGSSLQHSAATNTGGTNQVSVPFTSGSSLQRGRKQMESRKSLFQFPLHRDPRCN